MSYRLILAALFFILNSFTSLEIAPAAYKGRFRPSDISARLWLYEFYHAQELDSADLNAFQTQTPSALDLVWKMEFLGHAPFDDAPLFWVRDPQLRTLLHLQVTRASYNQLIQSFQTYPEILHRLVEFEFFKNYNDPSNRSLDDKLELKSLSPDLWAELKHGKVKIAGVPNTFPWTTLKPGDLISTPAPNARLADEILSLLALLQRYNSSNGIKLLAGKSFGGAWYDASVLKALSYNPTAYPNPLFQQIKVEYEKLGGLIRSNGSLEALESQKEELGNLLLNGYAPLQGTVYQKSYERELVYPSINQLNAEELFYRIPFAQIAILLYLAALTVLLMIPLIHRKWCSLSATILFGLAFIVHTFLLGLRIYILQRAPVSNMFETVIYVPWIAVIASFGLAYFFRTTLPLIASSALAAVLLTVLELTQLNNSFENVQAVLDSQYWLIIHVLMIVGSYGVLGLAGIIGHFYTGAYLYYRTENARLHKASAILLQALYLGVALLIPGTILGGVWAAESWGRFWDWDPKESWAFISAGVYLITIHAYRYGQIGSFGLAIGSIIGLMAISFTWYGVNYILGTGLHTYGFGSGGEAYYYAYLIGESLFVFFSVVAVQKYRVRKS